MEQFVRKADQPPIITSWLAHNVIVGIPLALTISLQEKWC